MLLLLFLLLFSIKTTYSKMEVVMRLKFQHFGSQHLIGISRNETNPTEPDCNTQYMHAWF